MQERSFNFNVVEKSLENLKAVCGFNSSFSYCPNNILSSEEQSRKSRNREQLVKDSLGILTDYISYEESSQNYSPNQFINVLDEVNRCLFSIESDVSLDKISQSTEYQKLKQISFLKEYPHLKEGFYSDEQTSLDTTLFNEKEESTSFLNNLVEIKKDASYELFYLKDSNGKKFYTEALTRILSKYGRLHEVQATQDPFIRSSVWNSSQGQRSSRLLLGLISNELKGFYKFAVANLSNPMIADLHNAITALMLSEKDLTLISLNPAKNNIDYFKDFLLFLRSALGICESPVFTMDAKQHNLCLSLIQALCHGLFSLQNSFEEASRYLFEFLTQFDDQFINSNKTAKSATVFLDFYESITKEWSKYPSGPVFKALDIIFDDTEKAFDPCLLGMLPSCHCVLKNEDYSVKIIGSPCPVIQRSIAYAEFNPEFLFFLNSLGNESVFILNLQNRLSKKDRARCSLIEDFLMRNHPRGVLFQSISDSGEILSFLESKRSPIEDFEEFIAILEEKLPADDGFYKSMNGISVDPIFFKELLFSLRDVFFKRKKSLFTNDKLLFLDLVAYFLVLKNVETHRPSSILVISKDGLDRTLSFSFGLEILLDPELCFSEDFKRLKSGFCNLMSPIVVFRNRLINFDSFEITTKLMNAIRKNKDYKELLNGLFERDLFQWKTVNND